METQAICVNEGSPGAEIKCHVGDLGFQVPETRAAQAASKVALIPSSLARPTCLIHLLWGPDYHKFAKRSKYGPTGTAVISDPVLLGKRATKLDSPPSLSAISQTGMKENGGGGVLAGKLQTFCETKLTHNSFLQAQGNQQPRVRTWFFPKDNVDDSIHVLSFCALNDCMV